MPTEGTSEVNLKETKRSTAISRPEIQGKTQIVPRIIEIKFNAQQIRRLRKEQISNRKNQEPF
jgi:hypothetical protein